MNVARIWEQVIDDSCFADGSKELDEQLGGGSAGGKKGDIIIIASALRENVERGPNAGQKERHVFSLMDLFSILSFRLSISS